MRLLSLAITALVVLGGCAAAGPTPPPSATTAGFSLRAWTTQALPPVGAFANAGPSLVIANDRLFVAGAVPAIYPGPLMTNLFQRQVSPQGIAAIIDGARSAGLLDGPTDLTGGSMPGAATGHLLFVIDGVEREVLGDPNSQIVCITTPCEAAPGTREAFGGFWARVHDTGSWLAGELGQEMPYTPERLAVVLTEPVIDDVLPPSFAAWPLDGPMAEFGVEFGGVPGTRCGVIEGTDLAPAVAAFDRANALTRWQDADGGEHGAIVRVLYPGEPDPC